MMDEIVISLCDETGNIVKPWAEAGYTCYCVDVEHGIRKDRIVGNIHYVWGDIRSWYPLHPNIKILFAAPPCTHVAVSGARDFRKKRQYSLSDSLELFDACEMAAKYSGAPYMIENPKGSFSTYKRKPDYIFDPCDYGDPYFKETHLWTGGGFVMPEKTPVEATEGSKMHLMPPSDKRQKDRSVTPMGFSVAVFKANNQP